MYQLGEREYLGLKGFNTLSVERESTFAEHKLIGTKPRQQRTGEELETLNLSIYLHASYCVPETELDVFENSRRVGYILPLIAGDGRYYGDYLINRLGYEVEKLNPDGSMFAARVSLSLKEYYYDDRAAAARRRARAQAFARPGVATPFATPPTPSAGQNAALAVTVAAILLAAGAVLLAARAAAGDADKRGFYLRVAAREASNVVARVQRATNAPNSGADGNADVQTQLATGALSDAAQRVISGAALGSLSAVQAAVLDLATAAAELRAASGASGAAVATGKSLTGQ